MSVVSRSVGRGAMVYVEGSASEPAGDVAGQTRRVLEAIERELAAAGSHKSKLLTAGVRSVDEQVWQEWLQGQRLPRRISLRGNPARPETLVEIVVTAVR